MKFGPRGSRHALQLQAVVAILDGNFLSPLTYPNAMDQVLNYVEANRSRYLDELKELIAIPSVSTDPPRTQKLRLTRRASGAPRSPSALSERCRGS